MRELQSLGLDVSVHKVDQEIDGTSTHTEVDRMADASNRRTPSRPTYESVTTEDLTAAPAANGAEAAAKPAAAAVVAASVPEAVVSEPAVVAEDPAPADVAATAPAESE